MIQLCCHGLSIIRRQHINIPQDTVILSQTSDLNEFQYTKMYKHLHEK